MRKPIINYSLMTLITIILFLGVANLNAEEQEKIKHSTGLSVMGAYYFGNQEGYGTDGGFAPLTYQKASGLSHDANDPGRDVGTTWGGIEAKFVLSHDIAVPVLTSNNPLFKGNNINFYFAGELTPISVIAKTEITFLPIAFLKFSTGGSIGTGWYIGLNGLGRNLFDVSYTAPQSDSLQGAVYKIWFSGTFQFDLGAIIKGDWNHIVMQVVPKFEYQAFTGADAGTAWQFEADDGENYDGWKFWGNYFLGYQMPLVLNLVGVLLETEQNIGRVKNLSTMDDGGWGSDFIFLRFGLVFNLKFSEKSSLALIPQFKTERDYTDATVGNRYFGFRDYEKTFVYFERLAFSYSLKF